jgi:hypothetical protein
MKGKTLLDYPEKLDWKKIFLTLQKDGYQGKIGLETHIFGEGQIAASHSSMKEILMTTTSVHQRPLRFVGALSKAFSTASIWGGGGGTSTGRTLSVTCDVQDPNNLRFCDQTTYDVPFRTLFRLSGTYGLPFGIRASEHSAQSGTDRSALACLVDCECQRTRRSSRRLLLPQGNFALICSLALLGSRECGQSVSSARQR